MRNYKLLMVWVLLGVTFANCDIPSVPKDPNFTTSNKIEAPLLFEKTFQFLGGGDGATEALIDTTGSEFDSLFAITEGGVDDGLISISREEEFEFGDLNDAIPTISSDPTNSSSAVGEIEIGSFSSGSGNLGTASFEELTGLDPAFVPAGTPIPGGSTPTPVSIDVGNNTDFFVSATVKRGAIEIGITNNLGFNISSIVIDLFSDGAALGSTTLNNVNHGTTSSDQIAFSEGDVLADIGVEISVNWNAQNTVATPGELIVEEINGVGLVASAVEAAVTALNFSSVNAATFDNAEFKFTEADHYVELESGVISIASIVNGLDLTIESLIISFPNIRNTPFSEADSLVISYTGDNRIFRSATSDPQNIDLAGYRIFALNGEVNYTISALTENTQEAAPGDQTRVISETDEVAASIEITNLAISKAFGEIATQTVILGEDDASNGTDIIDLYNSTEASLTQIDGLEGLSSEINGIEFAGASISISYTSNIGVPTTIYMAMLGIDGNDEELFLTGINNSDRVVDVGAPINGLVANGVQLTEDQLIKFTLEPSLDGNNIVSAIEFNGTNTNVNEFLNALPKEIRFIGKAVVNESGGEATISTPLEFDPGIIVDLPVYFTANGASIEIKEDGSSLSDLPGEDDNTQISEGKLIVSYQNGLPLGFDIEIEFLDDLGGIITSVPLAGDTPVELNAATVDAVTRFATSNAVGDLVISLNEDQLRSISNTDSVAITAALNTFATEAVKVKGTDSITLSISASFTIQTTVNND